MHARVAGLFMLLMLFLAVSVHGMAQASAAEPLPPREHAAKVARGAHGAVLIEPAHWRAVLNDAPLDKDPALEPETNRDPAAPNGPRVVRPAFGCTPPATFSSHSLQAASATYRARFAASPVLARAPPHGAC